MLTQRNILLVTVLMLSSAMASLVAQQRTGTRRIPQFENEDVKVWKSIIMPGQPLSMHRHENPRAVVALVGGTLKIQKDSGSSQTVVWETGKAYWLTADPPGELHADINETNKPIEVMVVELQKKK